MFIKVIKKVPGLPIAEFIASPCVTDAGDSQVTIFLRALDAHEQATMVATLRATPTEARDAARRLCDAAEQAEALSDPRAYEVRVFLAAARDGCAGFANRDLGLIRFIDAAAHAPRGRYRFLARRAARRARIYAGEAAGAWYTAVAFALFRARRAHVRF